MREAPQHRNHRSANTHPPGPIAARARGAISWGFLFQPNILLPALIKPHRRRTLPDKLAETKKAEREVKEALKSQREAKKQHSKEARHVEAELAKSDRLHNGPTSKRCALLAHD